MLQHPPLPQQQEAVRNLVPFRQLQLLLLQQQPTILQHSIKSDRKLRVGPIHSLRRQQLSPLPLTRLETTMQAL